MQKKLSKTNINSNQQHNIYSSPSLQSKRKIKYFTCTKGKDHQGEALNYVCINKDCKKRGLLCSICRIDHNNHEIIPLKILLTILQKQKQKPIQSSQQFQQYLSQFQLLHHTMLYNLKTCVDNLSYKFQQIQKKINNQFAKVKIQLFQRVQINMKFNQFVSQSINSQFNNRDSFISNMSKICEMLSLKQAAKQPPKQLPQKQQQIKFSINLDLVSRKYKQMKQIYSQNLQRLQKYLDNLIFPQYNQIKQHFNNNQIQSISNVIIPIFSSNYKSQTIILQEKDKIAKQTKPNFGRFVFTNIQVNKINQKILFRIKSLKNWIALGIGIRQKLKFLNYRFQYTNLGHGSYLISSNGFSWSHTDQNDNKVGINFKFFEGDLILLQYQKNKLIFTNKKNLKIHQLKLSFNSIQQKDIYFCANLCTQGDAVQIIQITN